MHKPRAELELCRLLLCSNRLIHTCSIRSEYAIDLLMRASRRLGASAQGAARSPSTNFGPIQTKPAAFGTSLKPSWMIPRQSLVLLLEYLMQSTPILTDIRQSQCLFSPNPAWLILRRAIEVNCAIECRCCKPLEFFWWIRHRLLREPRKTLCQIIRTTS